MTTDTLREAFEAWADQIGYEIGRMHWIDVIIYSNGATHHAWQGYQAAHDADKARIAVLEGALKSIDDVRVKFLESAENWRNHSLEHSIGASEVFQGCANELNDALQVYFQALTTQASEVE